MHVAQWGTFIRTTEVSDDAASAALDVTIDNDADTAVTATIVTDFYEIDAEGRRTKRSVASIGGLRPTRVRNPSAEGFRTKAGQLGRISRSRRSSG